MGKSIKYSCNSLSNEKECNWLIGVLLIDKNTILGYNSRILLIPSALVLQIATQKKAS